MENEHNDKEVVARLEKVATDNGLQMAQVALAWVLQNNTVSSVIVGATPSMCSLLTMTSRSW
jgi:aryl-alcohol dehydrogenase-like predicted oxidoreductase